jgi:hypothetical protein
LLLLPVHPCFYHIEVRLDSAPGVRVHGIKGERDHGDQQSILYHALCFPHCDVISCAVRLKFFSNDPLICLKLSVLVKNKRRPTTTIVVMKYSNIDCARIPLNFFKVIVLPIKKQLEPIVTDHQLF